VNQRRNRGRSRTLDEDVARLSPFISRHLSVQGHYYFSLPEMPAGVRELRDPDAPVDDGEGDRRATSRVEDRVAAGADAPGRRRCRRCSTGRRS
jgi:hypothetical protein